MAWGVKLGDLTIEKTNKNGHGVLIGEMLKLNDLGVFNLELLNPLHSDADKLRIVLAHFMYADKLTMEEAGDKIGESRFDDIEVYEYEDDLPKGVSTPVTP